MTSKRLNDSDIEVKREYFERLQCQLTEANLAEIARKIGGKRREVQELEAKKREVVDRLKSLIDGAQAAADELAEAAASGVEMRDVKCVEAFFWRLGTVVVKRADTGAVVTERPMTIEERQQRMPWAGAPEAKPKGKAKATSAEDVSAAQRSGPPLQLPPAEHDRKKDDGEEVTDPQSILDVDAGDGKPKPTKKKRGKKGSKR